jgi:hypothetical protein
MPQTAILTPTSQRVMAVLDLPPRQSKKNVRASFEAAAKRWSAKIVWITTPIEACHPFWQKMFVCNYVRATCGPSHVLQLDNDMVIRSDCPSPFELVSSNEFAMVSGRQSPLRRTDRASWNQMAHDEWARRCNVQSAPAWTHPNGGLYLYGTEAFQSMFADIIGNILHTGGKYDLGCDECLIINHLWTDHRRSIRFLPPEFNVNLHQTPTWASNPVMQSYIYHFVGPTKKHLARCRWQRANPPELPFPWDKNAKAIVDQFGDSPPEFHEVDTCLQADTISNLLAVYPSLRI